MKNKINPIKTSSESEENLINWNEIKNSAFKYLGKDIYESWIKNIELTKEYNHYVILTAPTRFVRDWIVSRYVDKILDLIQKQKQTIQRIEFEIKLQKSSISNSNEAGLSNFQQNYKKGNVASIEDSLLNYNRLDTKLNFENFVTGTSNQLAFMAAQKICEKNSSYNPLFIYGGVGMGKTHLLNAIGLKMSENLKIMYISAERFMYHFINSIKKNEMVKFKDFFRKTDVFIIDDIQFIRGKEAMQEEFFHTFNALVDRQSTIVISSDRAPSNLDRIQSRITSRLSGGLVVEIEPSDFDLRLEIIKKKHESTKQQFLDTKDLSEEVLKLLAAESQASIRDVIGALNRIQAFSRIYNKSPNVTESKIILKDIISVNARNLSIENIQKTVASYFTISLNEMLSPRRSRSLVRPRQIAMYLAKKLTTKSLPDIGRQFNNRDHTTVIHAVKTIENLIINDQSFKKSVEDLKGKFGQKE
tara:strand:+ start:446 stop:1864 length:1419 start_codon:yes stop_codon:yes gene_type:complete